MMEINDYFEAEMKVGAVTVKLERQNFPIDVDVKDITSSISKRLEFALKRCFDGDYSVKIEKVKKVKE